MGFNHPITLVQCTTYNARSVGSLKGRSSTVWSLVFTEATGHILTPMFTYIHMRSCFIDFVLQLAVMKKCILQLHDAWHTKQSITQSITQLCRSLADPQY